MKWDIFSRGPIARRDIARISGLSPAFITGITGELIELGLVQEAGEIESQERAGRRSPISNARSIASLATIVETFVRHRCYQH